MIPSGQYNKSSRPRIARPRLGQGRYHEIADEANFNIPFDVKELQSPAIRPWLRQRFAAPLAPNTTDTCSTEPYVTARFPYANEIVEAGTSRMEEPANVNAGECGGKVGATCSHWELSYSFATVGKSMWEKLYDACNF